MQVMTIFMSLSMYCPRPNFVVMFVNWIFQMYVSDARTPTVMFSFPSTI